MTNFKRLKTLGHIGTICACLMATPETNPHAKMAATWIAEWLTRMQATFGSVT